MGRVTFEVTRCLKLMHRVVSEMLRVVSKRRAVIRERVRVDSEMTRCLKLVHRVVFEMLRVISKRLVTPGMVAPSRRRSV